jgi:hypothetical protein
MGLSVAAAGLVAGLLAVGVVPAASAPSEPTGAPKSEICGSYEVNGNRYWANCTSHGQEIRWHIVIPPTPFNYDCVPAGESQYIGPSATVWDVVATGDAC